MVRTVRADTFAALNAAGFERTGSAVVTGATDLRLEPCVACRKDRTCACSKIFCLKLGPVMRDKGAAVMLAFWVRIEAVKLVTKGVRTRSEQMLRIDPFGLLRGSHDLCKAARSLSMCLKLRQRVEIWSLWMRAPAHELVRINLCRMGVKHALRALRTP